MSLRKNLGAEALAEAARLHGEILSVRRRLPDVIQLRDDYGLLRTYLLHNRAVREDGLQAQRAWPSGW